MHKPDSPCSTRACPGPLPEQRIALATALLLLGLSTLFFCTVSLAGPPAVADSTPPATPRATIQTITAEAIAALEANKAALASDPAGVAALIAGIVDPYLDFTIMSEEVLGVAWRRADARQRERFTKAFKTLLTNDYAAVLKQYNHQTIEVTGSRWEDSEHRRALVTSRVLTPGEPPTEVDYRLFHTARWQVYDVVVEGVSLLINYREVFASELQHETLDALIERLEQKDAALMAPNRTP